MSQNTTKIITMTSIFISAKEFTSGLDLYRALLFFFLHYVIYKGSKDLLFRAHCYSCDTIDFLLESTILRV